MRFILIGSLAFLVCFDTIGCGNNDNRTPDPADIKAANDKRLKYLDSLNLPPDAKKVIESHAGGPPYTPPGEVAAMAALAARNKNLPKGVRKF